MLAGKQSVSERGTSDISEDNSDGGENDSS